jgi:hypothetical protein
MHCFYASTMNVVMLLLSCSLVCISLSGTLQAQYQPAEVILVDVLGLSIYQDRTRYDLSAPRGDVQVRAYCRSGSVDASCREAAHNLLKQDAAQQGSNLAVIVNESILESHPPQYELSAVLYRMKSLP